MAASQVVLYFDKQEDALLFTLAASSVISSEAPVRAKEALVKIADEIRKASRIRTHGMLNPAEPASKEPRAKKDVRSRKRKSSASELRLTQSIPANPSCSAIRNPVIPDSQPFC